MELDIASNNGHEQWLTKGQAAERLNTTERTIERWVAERKLGTKLKPVPGRKPMPLIDATDVARIQSEQNRGSVLAPSRENEHTTLAIGAMLPGLMRSMQPPRVKPFMTLAEAAEYSSLPRRLLTRLIRSGKLRALRFAGSYYIKTRDVLEIELGPDDSDAHGGM